MNCYLCLRAGMSTSAVAVCRSCGAACCLDHLEERSHAGRGPGLQPMLAPHVEIFCQRCVSLQSSLFATARRKVAESVGAPTALKARSAPALPNAKEAISTVEELLGLDRTETKGARKRWRRLFGRKGAS